ncbi:refilin-A isoform X2 [Festucalex cinctus]
MFSGAVVSSSVDDDDDDDDDDSVVNILSSEHRAQLPLANIQLARLPYLLLNSAGTDPRTRMYPVFYGESIEVDPKPEQQVKCTSAVRYDSDKRYQDRVYCVPVPTATSFSETVVAVPDCTWRRYKSQVYLEPRQKAVNYQSTTIVYPKHAKNVYRTTLTYKAAAARRWFVSRVRLESSDDSSPCIIYAEDL